MDACMHECILHSKLLPTTKFVPFLLHGGTPLDLCMSKQVQVNYYYFDYTEF